MSFIDIIILLMLFFGLWQGFRMGLMRSLVSLFGWLFALVFATYFARPLSPLFVGMVDSPVLTMVISFIAVALGVIVALQIVLWIMKKTMDGLRLSPLDKLGGAIFGVAKNLLVVLVMISLFSPLMHNTKVWQGSQLLPELMPFSPFAVEMTKKMASQISDTTTSNLEKMSADKPVAKPVTR